MVGHSDSESRGTGFDSRLAQVTFGSLVGHVGVTFFHGFWKMLGSVWEYSGVVFGWVREVFKK